MLWFYIIMCDKHGRNIYQKENVPREHGNIIQNPYKVEKKLGVKMFITT